MTRKIILFKVWLSIHKDFVVPLQQARIILMENEIDDAQLIICQKKLEGAVSHLQSLQDKCDAVLNLMSLEDLDKLLELNYKADLGIDIPSHLSIRDMTEFHKHLSLYFNYTVDLGHNTLQLYNVLF